MPIYVQIYKLFKIAKKSKFYISAQISKFAKNSKIGPKLWFFMTFEELSNFQNYQKIGKIF